MQIFQQRCHGIPHQTIAGDGGGLCPVPSKLIVQHGLDKAGRIAPILHQLYSAVELLFHVRSQIPAVQHSGVHQHLTGVVTAQLGKDSIADPLAGKLCNMGSARGDIRKAKPCPLALEVDAGNVVVFIILEHTALNDRTRRKDPNDVPLDQALCLGRVLHLLTDGHLIPFGDQPGHIAFIAVEGHTAHGRPLRQAALLAGKGEVQLSGCCKRILKEHLIKIPDTVKEDLIFMLPLDLHILLHHGRQLFRRGGKLCHKGVLLPLLFPSARES